MGATQNLVKKVIIKDDYVKKDRTCTLYIYVSVDGSWDRIPLKLSWPPGHFDKDAGKIQPRHKDDKDFTDYQIIIDSESGKVNDIFKEYRLAQKSLTLSKLLEEYNSFTSRKDFFSFFEKDANERYKRKKIELGTKKGQLSSLASLKEFWASEQRSKKKGELEQQYLPFSTITPKLLENFRAWLKIAKQNIPSTTENHMKNVRTYVKRALADGNVFDDPFKVVKVTKPETYPDALTEEQLHALMDLFGDPTTPENWINVLRHFLFSCFTGLRISDVKAVSHEHIKGDWLVIMPRKTMGKQKTIRVPLHPMAKQLIISSVNHLFETYSDQYTNRLLTQIGNAARVDFKVKTYTARHTFGTLFIELGGDVVTLKEYVGHRDLGTTMKYVHISERRKREKINVFNKIQEGRPRKK